MDARTERNIIERLNKLERNAVTVRRGVLTDDVPLTVELGGSTVPYADVKTLASWTPNIGDDVLVLRWGKDLIVLPGEIS